LSKERIMSCHRVTRLVFATLSHAAMLLLAGASIASAGAGQPPPGAAGMPGSSADAVDPPGRVARISFLSGTASFRPASVDEWTNATLNYPLTIGDHLWTDRGARAELDLGTMVVRIAPLTEFSILNLDDRTAQLRVTQGSVAVRVRERGDDEDLEVDTPNGAADLLGPGNYRIDVNENGDASNVTVRHGEAEVTSAEATYPVQAAQTFALNGTVRPTHNVATAVPIDEFEDWSLSRDRRADSAQSVQYVSRGTIGYADLDGYGVWRTVPEYGAVWVPRVGPDWVPYRQGHWVWIRPWGWTWIDDAPWGFAPSHYGRWVYLPAAGPAVGGWGWVPGRVIARPVYAPALVAFVGGSSWHVAVSAGTAPVGWFPLGPREPFVPAYRVSPTYVHAVNVTHVNVTTVNVTNVTYVNREVPRAVTVVSRETFVQARPVAAAAVAVPREQLRVAAVIGHAPQLQPEHVSIAGHVTAVHVAAPPAVVVNRQVVVRRMPPPAAVSSAAAPGRAPAGGAPPRTPYAASRSTAAAQPVPPAPPAAARVAPVRPPAVAPPAPAAANVPPRAAGQPAQHVGPAAVAGGELAARHAHERAEFESRLAAERSQLAARHQHAEQAAANTHERAQLHQQHQHETQTLQERQRTDREALQKRQATERQQAAPRRTPDHEHDNNQRDQHDQHD
jgi:hypothetical protein